MAVRKTVANKVSVAEFLKAIPDARLREDSRAIARIMQAAAGARPRMWGSGIVGFGVHRHVEKGGRLAERMLIGFAPRRTHITLYILDGLGQHGTLLAKLGPHSVGNSCLHVKRLSELRLPVLTKIIESSVRERKHTSEKTAPKVKAKTKAKVNPKAPTKAPRKPAA